ncbi:MAG: right-handed parallel beta-helix repeat-containing protein [Atribacterota bacterium]
MKKFFIILFVSIVATVMGGCLNLEGILPFLNKAPVIISKPIITATEDQLYLYQIEASDPNGDTLTYSFIIKPEGMSIDSESGLISWIPANNQVGIHQIIVEISDGKQSVAQSFEIEVFNVNNPPLIFSYFPVNLNFDINEGDSVKFEVQTHDIDSNTTLSYQWLLNGMKVSSSTVSGDGSKSSWIYFTGYGDYGQKRVKVLVSDGELQDYVQWNITINDITPPAQPTLNTVTSPTNIPAQTLSGNKESNTSIWINGVEVISVNSVTTWSYSYNLSEGENNISIISKDTMGNESNKIYATIILDTIAPAIPNLEAVSSPTNISSQILSGTKEDNSSILINDTEVVSINSSTNWSYSYNLSEGNNDISITSQDAAGNESSVIIATIECDPNIYVDAANVTGIEDGTKTYPFNTITEGIDAVISGKSVMVTSGTYNEQLIISKSITLQGAEKESTIISGFEYTGNLITIEADGVKISGFKIDGISDTDVGIYSDSSSSIEISENIIQNQQDSGILYHSAGNDYSSGIYVYNNEICFNSKNGIKVTGEGSGIIESNTIRKNTNGIRTSNSASLEIKHNNINDNTSAGILCQDSSFLLIWGNEITINDYGIKVGVLSSDTTNPDIGGGTKDGVGQNKIAGNKTHGVSNKTTHNIMAKNNWWGDAAGPKYPYNPDGNADLLSDWAYWSATGGDIIFEDYLSTEPPSK